MDRILSLYNARVIPRIFHRVWVGGQMPDEFIETGQTWLEQNPGWELKLWTEDNLPKLKNQALFDNARHLVESRLIGRFRSNLARLEILHKFGGVYIDCDFIATKPIPVHYLSSDLFLPRENDQFVNNGLIGAIPKHRWLKTIIDAIPDSVLSQPGKPSNVTCGPHLLTRLLDDSVTLIPADEVYPYGWRDALEETQTVSTESWAHHLWAGSRNQVSVIIPWQGGERTRERAKDYTLRWFREEMPNSWQIVVAETNSKPFSKAGVVREAIQDTFGKIIVVHDADSITYGLPEAIELVKGRPRWSIPHLNVHRLTEEATHAIYQGGHPNNFADLTHEKPYKGVRAGGSVVLERDLFEECPPDPRFKGWGGEDESWGYALHIVANHDAPRIRLPLIHLWHTPPERINRMYGSLESKRLVERYRTASRNRQTMMNLIKEHRNL